MVISLVQNQGRVIALAGKGVGAGCQFQGVISGRPGVDHAQGIVQRFPGTAAAGVSVIRIVAAVLPDQQNSTRAR